MVKPFTSYLIEETQKMANQRREQEQRGHSQFGKVQIREHSDAELSSPQQDSGLDATADNTIPQHPLLDKQLYDGIDPDLNPAPPLNSHARLEYDNAHREQKLEQALRLGQAPTIGI